VFGWLMPLRCEITAVKEKNRLARRQRTNWPET